MSPPTGVESVNPRLDALASGNTSLSLIRVRRTRVRAAHARLRLTKTPARPRVFTSFTAYTP